MEYIGQLQMPVSIDTDVTTDKELETANKLIDNNPGVSREAILTYLWV